MTDMDTGRLAGWVAPGFEEVRQAFESNFAQGLEVGAGFAAYHRGQKVVDLWGGVADPEADRPWEEDTLVLVFSTTKGATALCAHRLAQAGALDLEAPVARVWPEFAQGGKEGVTASDLLSHQAGLAWIDGPAMTLEEALSWEPVVAALAAQAPLWEPRTQHGYHATTYGWLVGEVVRRVSGQSVGRFFAQEAAGPLGLDFWIGLPPAEDHRAARLIPFSLPDLPGAGGGGGQSSGGDGFGALADLLGADSPLLKALGAPRGAFNDPEVWNRPDVRAAEIPAANGVTDARSLARLYAAMVGEVDGVRLLGTEQLARATTQRTSGPNTVLLGLDIQFGLGFMVPSSLITLGKAAGATRGFGHFGAGGSVGWADPDAELAFGYVMNRMDLGLAGDLRSTNLIEATYRAAAGRG
jgi:CubicO group peptidase (beta-lactamase class C family)